MTCKAGGGKERAAVRKGGGWEKAGPTDSRVAHGRLQLRLHLLRQLHAPSKRSFLLVIIKHPELGGKSGH